MKKVLTLSGLSLLLILFTAGNFKSKYYFYDYEEYNRLTLKGEKSVLRRCILFEDIVKQKDMPHKIEDKKQKTAAFIHLLRKQNIEPLHDFIRKHDSSLNIHNFYLGLYSFKMGKYELSKSQLKNYSEQEYQFQKFLVMADCTAELVQKSDLNAITSAYQNAIDETNSELLQELIHNRIRYFIYNQ